MDLRKEPASWLTKAEWGACIGATVASVALHLIFLAHAGALWRDETSTAHLATFTSLREMWDMLGRDSFPALFPMLVRGWAALGLGRSDFGLRCLGCLIGLLVLAMLWFNARLFGLKLPLVSLGLLSVNLTLVRWGDSLRALGLGSGLVLLTLGLVWSLIRAPGRRPFVAAAVAAVLSVQCLYQNAFLLIAICLAASVVCFRCQRERAVLWVLGVGAVAAVSLLPYAGLVAASQRWYIIEQTGFNAAVVWSNLAKAVGSPQIWEVLVWLAVCLLALACGLACLVRPGQRRRIGPEDLPLYAAINLGGGVFFFFFFLIIAKLPTQVWYWLPAMTLAAVCADAALASWATSYRAWRLGLVILLVCVPLVSGVKVAERRQTNLDLVAARLRELAKPDDFIVVYPWYFGVTFNRYYHGETPWATLPPLADLRLHRYDLVKEQLAAAAPLQPVLERMSRALTSGNRLWIVGKLPVAQFGQEDLTELPPAPEGPWEWSDVPYIHVWGRQVEQFLARHADRLEAIPVTSITEVNEFEDAPLTVATGLKLTP